MDYLNDEGLLVVTTQTELAHKCYQAIGYLDKNRERKYSTIDEIYNRLSPYMVIDKNDIDPALLFLFEPFISECRLCQISKDSNEETISWRIPATLMRGGN